MGTGALASPGSDAVALSIYAYSGVMDDPLAIYRCRYGYACDGTGSVINWMEADHPRD